MPAVTAAKPLRMTAVESVVVIEFAGEPVGKARPRLGKGHVYTPRKTASFETALGWCARVAMRGRGMLEGPLSIYVRALFTHDTTHKTVGDYVLKSVCDALQGICFKDDAAIVDARIIKMQGSRPGLRIEVVPV